MNKKKAFLITAALAVASAAAIAQEQVWGQPGSDCPWGSSSCREGGLGAGSSNQSPPAAAETPNNLWDSAVWDSSTWGP